MSGPLGSISTGALIGLRFDNFYDTFSIVFSWHGVLATQHCVHPNDWWAHPGAGCRHHAEWHGTGPASYAIRDFLGNPRGCRIQKKTRLVYLLRLAKLSPSKSCAPPRGEDGRTGLAWSCWLDPVSPAKPPPSWRGRGFVKLKGNKNDALVGKKVLKPTRAINMILPERRGGESGWLAVRVYLKPTCGLWRRWGGRSCGWGLDPENC